MACGADIFDVTLCRVIQHVLLEDQNIPYARVQNRAGNFVLPGQANFSTLGAEFTLPQSVTSPDWVSVVIGNSSKSPPAALPFSHLMGHMLYVSVRCLPLPDTLQCSTTGQRDKWLC